MRVEGVVKLFQLPFVVTDALARVIFLFVMERGRLRFSANEKRRDSTTSSYKVGTQFYQGHPPIEEVKYIQAQSDRNVEG